MSGGISDDGGIIVCCFRRNLLKNTLKHSCFCREKPEEWLWTISRMDVQTVIQGNVFREIVNRSFPFEEDMSEK